jgi:hypothetical protein
MELRVRLLALLVAVLCAVGWVRTERPHGLDDEGVASGDDVGVLPARRQQAPAIEADLDDDDPTCWAAIAEHGMSFGAASCGMEARSAVDPLVARARSSVRQRGPPFIA